MDYLTVNKNNELELVGTNETLSMIYNHWNNLKKQVHISSDNTEEYIRTLEYKLEEQRRNMSSLVEKEVGKYVSSYKEQLHDLQESRINEKKHYEDYIDKLNSLLIVKKETEPVQKITSLVSVGQSYEDEIEQILRANFSNGYEIIHDTTKFCGDITIINKLNNVRICIEAKNYSNVIPQKERIKFITDVCNKDNNFSAGIFISKSIGLANTGYVEWNRHKPCFYITENNIPFLISAINFLFSILKGVRTEDTDELKRTIREYLRMFNTHKKILERMGKTIKTLTKEYTEMYQNIDI